MKILSIRRDCRWVRQKSLPGAGYPKSEPPSEFLLLTGSFSTVFAFLFGGRGKRVGISQFEDAAITALAARKLSRIMAKDCVTTPFSAPFARLEESRARVNWIRRGCTLITCPFCVAPWVAPALKGFEKLAPGIAFHVILLVTLVAASGIFTELYARLKDEE